MIIVFFSLTETSYPAEPLQDGMGEGGWSRVSTPDFKTLLGSCRHTRLPIATESVRAGLLLVCDKE